MLASSLAAVGYSTFRRHSSARAAALPTRALSADLNARLGMLFFQPGYARAHPDDPLGTAAARPLQISLKEYKKLQRRSPNVPLLSRRITLLTGLLQGPNAAWQWIQAHPDTDPRFAGLWRAAYAPGELSSSELQQALAQHARLRLSWYGELMRWQLYRKAGEETLAAQALAGAQQRILPATIAFLAVGMAAGAAGLLGLVLWILILARAIPIPRPLCSAPFSALTRQELVEGFAVWFFLFAVGSYGVRLLVPKRPDGTPALSYAGSLGISLAFEVAAAIVALALLVAAARRHHAFGPLLRAVEAPAAPLAPAPHEEPTSLDVLTPPQAPSWPDAPSTPTGLDNTAQGSEPWGPVPIQFFAPQRRPTNPGPAAPPAQGRLLPDILWGVGTYLAALPVLVVTALVLSPLDRYLPTPPNPAATMAMGTRGALEWVLLAVMVVVTAPILEETFFRGILYTALRKRIGVGASVALSAAAFAAVHPQLPLGFFPIMVLGALFAYVAEVRRSLVPSMVAHALNNAMALIFIALMRTP